MKHKLSICLLLSVQMVVNPIWADTWIDPETGYRWTYQIYGEEISIYNDAGSAISPRPSGSVTIPSMIDGNPVTSIGQSAFYGCNGLTSVTIPEGVKSIESFAFDRCLKLRDVTIPDSVTRLSNYAFYNCNDSLFDTNSIPGVKMVDGWVVGRMGQLPGILDLTGARGIVSSVFSGCTGLTNVIIPGSVTSIGESAFSGCSDLMGISIGVGVATIGNSAFSGCSCLTSVVIPEGVLNVGSRAFYGCSRLKSVTISSSVMRVGVEAFEGCRESLFDTTSIPGVKLVDGWAVDDTGQSLGNLTLTGVRGIADWAFRGCSIGSVVIPDSVLGIGAEAFSWCIGLSMVSIPNSVRCIGNGAFWSCENLRQITIPDSVSIIEQDAFGNCRRLQSFTVSSGNLNYKSESGLLLSKDGVALILVPGGLENVTIPEGVKRIGERAFVGCNGLKSLNLPIGVTSIERWAFDGCGRLQNVTIPDSIEEYRVRCIS